MEKPTSTSKNTVTLPDGREKTVDELARAMARPSAVRIRLSDLFGKKPSQPEDQQTQGPCSDKETQGD